MEKRKIKINQLVQNMGQVEGLPSNPRQWTRTDLELLTKSIEETPELLEARGVLVYPVGNEFVIIGGNMRYAAVKELGWDEVTCEVLPVETPVETLKAMVIKDNGSFGNWDYESLANEWDDLPLADWGAPSWDAHADASEPHDVHEDGFDADKDEVPQRCVRGDVFQLGNHRLMCGDSTNVDDLDKLMGGAVAQMLFTDPPYGYSYQSNFRKDKFDVIENDDTFIDFMPAIRPFVDGFVFVCTTWKVLHTWLKMFSQSYQPTNMLVWDKGNAGGLGDLSHTFATDYEIILCAHNGHEITGKRLGSVWRVGKDDVNAYVHPTQKPIGLSAMAIENTTNAHDIVLDVFGGSGSTLMACEQLDRQCRMMELDEHYCDVIIARWEKMTGKTANKI